MGVVGSSRHVDHWEVSMLGHVVTQVATRWKLSPLSKTQSYREGRGQTEGEDQEEEIAGEDKRWRRWGRCNQFL